MDSSVGNKVVLKSYLLNINGNQTRVVCKAEDTLLTVIRNHLKLTCTKRGCECGQCGVCNVIVNGKVMRACIVRMKSVPEYADILTVEGLGTPDHLHAIRGRLLRTTRSSAVFVRRDSSWRRKGFLISTSIRRGRMCVIGCRSTGVPAAAPATNRL
ncbi:MAG: 2Fe-2S iron-sulfur cluster-binding protein [Synergistaceae bacterium]|nr:2Fe-2S iron-sulfur cluster-binding protein [Synergistaceae bacterium]